MRKTNLFRYYAFGYNYQLLRQDHSARVVNEDGSTNTLVYLLAEYFDFLQEFDLRVTRFASEPLAQILAEALTRPKGATVGEDLSVRVLEAVSRIDVTLDSEMQMTVAYVTTPKRYAIAQLVDSPGTLLGTGVYDQLLALAQYDFAEACRCIAYERPTAGAFHLMRCVEGVLRDYYCSIVKRNRVKKLMWFDMLQHLETRRNAPPKPLLDNLDTIRKNFRNPTQHPDARYDLDEVQDLLAVTVDAVNRMARDRKQRTS